MLSIIVISSDGYSDCWDPFFKLLKKNFSGVEKYEILLSTNTKEYSFPDLNIRTLGHGKDVSWAKRVKLSLEQAKNDIVLILIEDMFLGSEINIEEFNNFLSLMNNSTEIDHIQLLSTRNRTKMKPSKYDHLDEIIRKTKMRFIYLPGLWKKEVLKKYLYDHENIYLSEKLGDIRSRIYSHGFYAVSSTELNNSNEFYNSRPSGALYKGKWQNSIRPLLEKNKIEIDFTKRGFVDSEYIKSVKSKSKLEIFKNPFYLFKSFLLIIILYITKK